MAAIDPPYRFDPWQNLVGVHWASGAPFLHQIFIFRRWHSGRVNGAGPHFFGDWYPISDQFAHAAYDAGELALSFGPGIEISTGSQLVNYMTWTEGRDKRSDLIKDGVSLSLGITESDRTAWSGSFLFYYWDMNSIMNSSAWTEIQPSRGNLDGIVYHALVGRYEEDDMSPSDWSDLASGTGAFDGVPEFTPP